MNCCLSWAVRWEESIFDFKDQVGLGYSVRWQTVAVFASLTCERAQRSCSRIAIKVMGAPAIMQVMARDDCAPNASGHEKGGPKPADCHAVAWDVRT